MFPRCPITLFPSPVAKVSLRIAQPMTIARSHGAAQRVLEGQNIGHLHTLPWHDHVCSANPRVRIYQFNKYLHKHAL